jgi:hypothetical protein
MDEGGYMRTRHGLQGGTHVHCLDPLPPRLPSLRCPAIRCSRCWSKVAMQQARV